MAVVAGVSPGRRPGWRAAAMALMLCLSAQAAQGALFDDEEARKRINLTNERLDKLQRDLDARLTVIEQLTRNQGLELFGQIETLKADVARMRGQIEVLIHELTEAQKRQRDLYVDLDARIRKLEAAAAAPPVAAALPPAGEAGAVAPGAVADPGAAPGAPASVAAEQRAYDGALDQFKRGDYAGAIAGFGAFVKANPKSALAPSAQYWIGNAQFARRDYRGAIAAQRQLLATYPDSAKVPDALLNIASAQSELGEAPAARRTLEELVAKFPQSEAAVKAKQRLSGR